MVIDQSSELDAVFHALAHPARREILHRLSSGEERTLTELCAPLEMSFPAASKHVRVLERARLVRRRVSGRSHLCRLHAGPLKEASAWAEGFRAAWESRFDAVGRVLDAMPRDEQES